MASRINRPRPATKHGLASDVRSTDYQTRLPRPPKAASVKSAKPNKPATRRDSDRRQP